jgi:AraC family transcriptional regulator
MADMNIIDELIEYVDLRINNCGHMTHEAGWSEEKVHPDYDLWYIMSGEVTIDYLNKKSTAYEGDIVFFNPGVPYSAYCLSEQCTHIYIHFDFPLGQRFNILNEFDLMGVIPHRYLEKEGTLFRNIFDDYKAKDHMASLMLKGYFLILLARILAIPQKNHSEYKQSFQQTKHFTKLKPVLQYIEEHISENVSPEYLADMIGMSPKYFYTFFKKNIGLTPQNYMTKIKMNRARDLLYERELTVKEIAYQLGFTDPYTFSKIFKRLHKISPSKFFDHT